MKRSLSLIPLAAVALLALPTLPGCETLTETAGQNGNKIARVAHIDLMQVTDDLEEIALLDHPSWLSRKPMPDY